MAAPQSRYRITILLTTSLLLQHHYRRCLLRELLLDCVSDVISRPARAVLPHYASKSAARLRNVAVVNTYKRF
jgi:hypothetical protein